MTKLHGLGVAAALVAAFGLGTRFGGGGGGGGVARVEVHREPATTRVVTETRSATGATLSAEEIRAIVREELAAAREPAPEPDPQVVEAREQAVARSHELVARAIDQGEWTEQDRDNLRAAMAGLDRAQVDEVMAHLIPALNEGRMTLAFRGTPM